MPLPRIQVMQEIQNSINTNKRSGSTELVNGDKIDNRQGEDQVDGDSGQEKGSMVDSPVAFNNDEFFWQNFFS